MYDCSQTTFISPTIPYCLKLCLTRWPDALDDSCRILIDIYSEDVEIFLICILDIFAISWVIGENKSKRIHKKKPIYSLAWGCSFLCKSLLWAPDVNSEADDS